MTYKALHMIRRNRAGFLASTLTLLFIATLQTADSRPAPGDDKPQWSLTGVRHVIGLPGIKPGTEGRLWFSGDGLRFDSAGSSVLLKSSDILTLSLGNERRMRGGALGRLARLAIPGAGGIAVDLAHASEAFSAIPVAAELAASAVTQGRTDIITLEFLDEREGYHGAVFTTSWQATRGIEKIAVSDNAAASVTQGFRGCQSATANPAISLLPVMNGNADVPAEYKVLLYERLLARLQKKQSPFRFYRAGSADSASGCPTWRVRITTENFHKGNAVTRAIVGPAGLFVATTSLECRVVAENTRGVLLLDDRIRATVRGDRESLDLSYLLANLIARKIEKLRDTGELAECAPLMGTGKRPRQLRQPCRVMPTAARSTTNG